MNIHYLASMLFSPVKFTFNACTPVKLYDNENPPLSGKFWNVKLFREIKMQSPDWLKRRINDCRSLTALLIEKHAGACNSNTSVY